MNEAPEEKNGWVRWSMYVLEELKRLAKCIEQLFSKLNALTERVVKIETSDEYQSKDIESVKKKRTKQSLWGALGGGSIAAIIELIRYLIEKYG